MTLEMMELDEANLKLTGSEVITYFNNSPNTLAYLWLQDRMKN